MANVFVSSLFNWTWGKAGKCTSEKWGASPPQGVTAQLHGDPAIPPPYLEILSLTPSVISFPLLQTRFLNTWPIAKLKSRF